MLSARGSVQIFTFKAGVFSKVAHDLRLSFRSFSITLDGEAVAADFELRELGVDGAVEGGRLRPYDAEERAEVERAMHGELLETERFPVARFRGTAKPNAAGFAVSGNLELKGKTAPLSFQVEGQEERHRASFEIAPSRWGIARYRAFLGAVNLEDRVRVELSLSSA